MNRYLKTMCAVLVVAATLALLPLAQISAAAPLSPSAGSYLDENSTARLVYDQLKTRLADVSSGKTTSTAVTVDLSSVGLKYSATQLGCDLLTGGQISPAASNAAKSIFLSNVDLVRIVYRIQADCPYETYWYDPLAGIVAGYSMSCDGSYISIDSITVKFAPNRDYEGSEPFTVDASRIAAAQTAITNADAIIAQHAGLNDRDKLEGYRATICELVSYDTGTNGSVYDNSLHMINVFDGNKDTNVICEGYAKAFQYLCQRSTFEGNVICYTVNGTMDGGTGAGNHTWNIVTIDGQRYAADLTNCDSGTIGADTKLFLATPTTTVGDTTYSFKIGAGTITYSYDILQKDLFCDGYPTLTASAASNDPVIAKAELVIVSPVAGTSFVTEAVSDDTRYTGKVLSWYDITEQRVMTDKDLFVNGYKYEATVLFEAKPGYSFDDSTVFYINGSTATVADGIPAQRKVTFLATPEIKLMYDLKVTGGKATVGGVEVTKAYEGDRVIITADTPAVNTAFSRWNVLEGGMLLSNDFAAEGVFFTMPANAVKIEASFRELAHVHKFDQAKADDIYLASAATCTAKAKYFYSCLCGESEHDTAHTFESGELAAHVYDQKKYEGCLATEATCTQAATYYYSCKCGEIAKDAKLTFVSDEIADHTYGDWIIDKQAAPGIEGSQHKECTVCGSKTEAEAIPALPAETSATPSIETTEPAQSDGGCGGALTATLSALALLMLSTPAIYKKKK